MNQWISGIERAVGEWSPLDTDDEILGSSDLHLRTLAREKLTVVEVRFVSGKRRQRKLCQRHVKLFLQITQHAPYRRILGAVYGQCDYCLEDEIHRE